MYKVIIIDDEKAAIETLRRDLEVQADLEIKGTAGNGAKGKKLIMDIHPDLLFLDIELPDIQGIRLLSEIREQVLWDMKVVFYTAYDKYLLQALRESAFDYLLKPYDIEELNLIIERYRKTMASAQPLPSFASAVGTLMPGRDFNQTKLCLKKNTTAGDIIGYSDAFVQISQSAIININYLAMIKSKQCLLYPPFSDKEDLIISRGFLKELQERFCII